MAVNAAAGMTYKFLGKSGIRISQIGYGNWINSNSEDQTKRTVESIQHALDKGINFFDTAETYGLGSGEI
jgi:aryl-alcohol dehydrogenase-like predicted oxidoreductase